MFAWFVILDMILFDGLVNGIGVFGSRNGRLAVINKLGRPKSKLRSVVVSNQRWLLRATQSIVA